MQSSIAMKYFQSNIVSLYIERFYQYVVCLPLYGGRFNDLLMKDYHFITNQKSELIIFILSEM